jgi:serine/threonine protein kinase
MPADAVLRVALEIVAALQAASFHGLTHPAIQPSNIVIVRGKTAEGGWPFVKLTHFALSGFKSAPGRTEPDLSASEFASPEQLLQGKVDFQSEIYSLGATMCFLLTGVFFSAYPRSPQTKRFVRPLRNLIARTLEDDATMRPQDAAMFAKELRACLVSVERRQMLQQRFGIPFGSIAPSPPRERRFRRRRRPVPLIATIGSNPVPVAASAPPIEDLASEDMEVEEVPASSRMRPVWAVAIVLAALFAIAAGAAFFVPEDVITTAFHRKKPANDIGVPVGVPENSPTNVAQSKMVNPPPAQRSLRPGESRHATASANSGAVAHASVSPAAPPSSSPAPVVAQSSAQPSQAVMTSNSPVIDQPQPNEPASPVTAEQSRSEAEVTTASKDAGSAPESHDAPVAVAADNAPAEPVPPAEQSEESSKAPSDQGRTGHEDAETDRDSARSDSGSHTTASQSPTSSESKTAKSRTKKKATTAQNRGRSGTLRGRVVGITPNGNVILELPSGQRAIVSPQDGEHYPQSQVVRRPRRVYIERRVYDPQYPDNPPYQPFINPSD